MCRNSRTPSERSTAVQAQEAGRPVRRTRARPLPALRFEAVQKELSLTNDQIEKSEALLREFDEAIAKQLEDAFNGRDLEALSDREQDKWYDIVRKINDDFEPKLKLLLQPEQLARAQQIAYQHQGPAAGM